MRQKQQTGSLPEGIQWAASGVKVFVFLIFLFLLARKEINFSADMFANAHNVGEVDRRSVKLYINRLLEETDKEEL